jgi:hypothetical protein
MRNMLARLRPGVSTRSTRPVVTDATWGSLRAHAVHRAHETLAVVPTVVRRVGTFLLIGSIAMAAFAVGMLFVVWHAVA